MRFGRRLGIDFGHVRVGIALCDDDGLVCTPLTTLKNDGTFFSKLSEIISEYEPVKVYVGKPKQLSGVEGTTAESVSNFIQRFEESFGVAVQLIDERLTSKSAEQKLRLAGKSAKESRGLIDQLAATAILELGVEMDKRDRQ